jgi:MFS family permease
MPKQGQTPSKAGKAVPAVDGSGWVLAGIATGVLIGAVAGWYFAMARLPIPGFAPLAANGASVPMFLFAVCLGSAAGLTVGLIRLLRYPPGGGNRNAHHAGSKWVSYLPTAGTVLIIVFMAYTLATIGLRGLGSGDPSDQSNRVTWHQKNATRVGGLTDAQTQAEALAIAYPSSAPANSAKRTVDVPNDWRVSLAATPLIARPTDARLVVREGGESGGDPAATASEIDGQLSAARRFGTNVMIVSADADARWALPAAAYAARTGTPILFVSRNGVPNATAIALAGRERRARIFVMGPPSVVSQDVFGQLQQHGEATRIEASSPEALAVEFARFRDDKAGFGWGFRGKDRHQWSSHNYILVNPDRWQDAIAGAHLARGGKSGPLLYAGPDRLSPEVDAFLWRQRPIFAQTPAEGPFNHLWVVGSFDRISYRTQAWADFSQEIEQYMTLGDSAVSGFEALGIGWIIASIAIAAWVFVHSRRVVPQMMPIMRHAWFAFALLLGPLALWLYLRSYVGVEMKEKDGMTMWERPLWLQTISATVMMFGLDMILMVLAVFAIAYFGFPLLQFNGPLYWVGTSMFLMMVLMYVVALVLMMIFFHTPMTMHEKGLSSYGKAFVAGLPMMLATMTVESAGMMPAMWWAQMYFLPAMQMPTEDDITMWATLIMSVVVGLLVVLPFNHWMVRRGAKSGMM